MQPGRRGRNDLFGFSDPIAEFGNIDRARSLFPSMFGDNDPTDDPFFNRPLGSMFGPGIVGSSMFGPGMVGSSMLGPGMVGSSMFGPDMSGSSMFRPDMFGSSMFGPNTFGLGRNHFGHPQSVGFPENQPWNQAQQTNQSSGPIITEITSDDEDEGGKISASDSEEKKKASRKHSRSGKQPYIEEPDDQQTEEKKIRHVQSPNNNRNVTAVQPQTHFHSFQSSSVTYGGRNGAYYTSSTTRRTGSDGVTLEESKEADTTTGKAAHRISRGHYDKGHSRIRNLKSDGTVETNEMLHNLNQNELAAFNEGWEVNARRHLPGWNQGLDMLDNHSGRRLGASRINQNMSLPSTTQQHQRGRMGQSGRGA